MSLGSNELVLFTHNTGSLYPMRKRITERWLRRQLKGEYDREAAIRSWMTLANAGAKRYEKELRLTEPWHKAFTTADREAAAQHWERWFRESARTGEFDWMLPASKRPKRAINSGKAQKKATKKKAKKRTRRTKLCPVGMQVQTLIFPKSMYSLRQARDWARRHDYSAAKIDETADSYRLRQKDPSAFQAGMFRTISLGQVQAVVGCPKIGNGRRKKTTAKAPTKNNATKKKTAKKKTTKKKTAKKKTAKKKTAKKKTAKKKTAKGWETANSPTLTEELKARGMTHAKAPGQNRRHVKRFGRVLFTGTASETWAWLKTQPKPKKKAKKKAAKKRTTKRTATRTKRTASRTPAAPKFTKVKGVSAYISGDSRFVIEKSEMGDFLLLDTRGVTNPQQWRPLGRYSKREHAERAARDFR